MIARRQLIAGEQLIMDWFAVRRTPVTHVALITIALSTYLMKKPFVVVDYSPDVIEFLTRQHIECLYGDATDNELLAELHMAKAQLVVSTITDQPTNISLLKYAMHHNQRASFICHADDYNQAAELYNHGAAYVILPHFIGSERMSNFLNRNGLSKKSFERHCQKHLMALGQAAIDHS